MSSTLTNLLFHIVFSTKDRAPFITPTTMSKLHTYIGGIIRGEKGLPITIGGTEDHVHILAKLPASISLSDMMQHVKGGSSKWMNEQPWRESAFAWQRGYAAFSVSQSMIDRVTSYINTQEEHHHKTGFKEELIELLLKHEVDYDERYLFN